MGITFCKHDAQAEGEDSISSYSFRSGLIMERFEKDVHDDHKHIESLGSSSTSTASSVQKRDDNESRKNLFWFYSC